MKKKVIAVIGLFGVMLSSVSGMDLFKIENGMSGMKRDMILKLLKVEGSDEKIKAIIGMCLEHYQWKNHSYFTENRPPRPTEAYRLELIKQRASDKQVQETRTRLGISEQNMRSLFIEELFDKFNTIPAPTALEIASFADAVRDKQRYSGTDRACPTSLSGTMLNKLGKDGNSLAETSVQLTNERLIHLIPYDVLTCTHAGVAIHLLQLNNQRGGLVLSPQTKQACVRRCRMVTDLFSGANLLTLLTKFNNNQTYYSPLVCAIPGSVFDHLPYKELAETTMAALRTVIYDGTAKWIAGISPDPILQIESLTRRATQNEDLLPEDYRTGIQKLQTIGRNYLIAASWENILRPWLRTEDWLPLFPELNTIIRSFMPHTRFVDF